eukprot:189237-Chlamydomonas_euryale.AAC.2
MEREDPGRGKRVAEGRESAPRCLPALHAFKAESGRKGPKCPFLGARQRWAQPASPRRHADKPAT